MKWENENSNPGRSTCVEVYDEPQPSMLCPLSMSNYFLHFLQHHLQETLMDKIAYLFCHDYRKLKTNAFLVLSASQKKRECRKCKFMAQGGFSQSFFVYT